MLQPSDLPVGATVASKPPSELEAACARVAHALRSIGEWPPGLLEPLIAVAQTAIRAVPPRTIFNVPEESLRADINLDVCCGAVKQEGWTGMDQRNLPGVDIVHDVEDLPWPLVDNSCKAVLLSHALEHLNPKYNIDVFNEIWRVMRPNGKLFIAVPYANSTGGHQDPTHMRPGFNEQTFAYFCPVIQDKPSPLYECYRPKPWKVVGDPEVFHGHHINVVLEAMKRTEVGPAAVPVPIE